MITWTELPDKSGTTMTAHTGDWPALVERLRNVGEFASKDRCPWLKLATFGDKRSSKNSLRTNENLTAVYGVELDYDGGVLPIEKGAALLEQQGIKGALYPSPSSTATNHRWRVICPTAQQHPPSARAALLARVNGALGGIAAPESFTLSQGYFFGATPTNDYRVLVTDGQCIDELDELDDGAIGKQGGSKDAAKAAETAPCAVVLESDTVRDLRSALAALRADDRTQWVDVGHALKTAGEPGRALWLEWSQTSDKYDPQDAADKWDSFKPKQTGYQSVFAKAQAAGWLNPKSHIAEVASPDSFDDLVAQAKKADWPDLADPFEQYAVPAFPVDALPAPFAALCRELSAQSGFDVGGYAFSLLVGASSLIDHRARMRAGPLSAPAYLWGGLVANSGGGKSPTINAALAGVRRINDALLKTSQRDSAKWQSMIENASKEDRKLMVRPQWRQLIASDTTTEGLGKLLQDNDSGVLLVHDELTEFIGRMDAYSATGSGKDRGVYLRAYDGGSVTINRAGAHPMLINNFSVGIMAGIQPEKLGELFRKSGGGADGLYQRFLMFVMQPAGRVDYSATLGEFTEKAVSDILDTLHFWTEIVGFEDVRLCPEGLPLMEAYHQEARTVSQRTPGKRLAEHLDKFPGFLARVGFALHCMEGAASGVTSELVSVATLERAKRIMRCMYHHSTAVYEVLDSHSSDATKLTKSACEAILSKAWETVQRGDLTRHATDWRNADDRQAEGAIDCLIEFGWLRDITPAVERGKRGRRSNGVFLVNPKVHDRFKAHAERIKESRNARFKAIQELAAVR